MAFHVRQLDELENLSDTVNVFDETSREVEADSASDSSVSWRRGMIERASKTVRQIFHKPLDLQTNYETGSLIYDANAKKFGRVNRSAPNYLKLSYLSGGSKEYGATFGDKPAVQIPPKKAAIPKAKKKVITKPTAAKAPTLKAVTKAVPQKPKKPAAIKLKQKPVETASKTKKPTSAKKSLGKKMVPSVTHVLPKGGMTDPVADPNGYIKQHYLLMSNRDLASVTGLSEHTIRRKLGEWGLRREERLKSKLK